MKKINIIGAGLAGCEAAWQAAKRGVAVTLYDMKPNKFSPAHHNANPAELVCSNSLRSDDDEQNAVGLMHYEMRNAGSLLLVFVERICDTDYSSICFPKYIAAA